MKTRTLNNTSGLRIVI